MFLYIGQIFLVIDQLLMQEKQNIDLYLLTLPFYRKNKKEINIGLKVELLLLLLKIIWSNPGKKKSIGETFIWILVGNDLIGNNIMEEIFNINRGAFKIIIIYCLIN